jgi:hypothetical protein
MANMRLIETKTVGAGGVANIEFTSIPQTYTDLRIVYSARSTSGSGYSVNLYLTFNNSTSRYYENLLYSSAGIMGGTNKSNTDPYLNWATLAQGAETNVWTSGQVYITNYTSSNSKSLSSDFVSEGNNTSPWQMLNAGAWNPTSNVAITSIKATSSAGNIAEGSTFYLYGVSNTIASGAKAYGGYVSEDTNYWYHTFLSSGTFTPTQSLSCDILVVAGGGGGATARYGNSTGGGGGAGGLVALTSQSLSATAYSVTVGAGGVRGTASVTATQGGNSQFASTTAAVGGGRGAGYNGGFYASGTGGSGGGGQGFAESSGTTSGAAGTSGQGNTGGSSIYNYPAYTNYASGGGGGAGAVGQDAQTQYQSGNGGNGSNAYSSWASATITGDQGYYAGGGAGGGYINSPLVVGGNGGLGGGGDGEYSSSFSTFAGATNTGGGGAGGSTNFTTSGAGGSGLVIVRYAK